MPSASNSAKAYELAQTARKPVIPVNNDSIEASSAARGEQLVELRPTLLRAAHAYIGEFRADWFD
jgi:hypothetical protein